MSRELKPLETETVSESEFRRRNRRSFFIWISLFFAGGLGVRGIFKAEEDRGLPWPLRRMGEWGDSFWKSQFSSKLAPTRSELVKTPPRLNGDIGVLPSIDRVTWRMAVSSPSLEKTILISLADLEKLPQVTETFEFKCVEGWSEWMSFTGVRFGDFLNAQGMTSDVPQYAGFSSVNGEYYVAMDLKSLLHPQTLLCLKMNGETLSTDHGFPVRLVTSVKYGVKSIKQIGSITFSETPPADFWAESGYGEYLGL